VISFRCSVHVGGFVRHSARRRLDKVWRSRFDGCHAGPGSSSSPCPRETQSRCRRPEATVCLSQIFCEPCEHFAIRSPGVYRTVTVCKMSHSAGVVTLFLFLFAHSPPHTKVNTYHLPTDGNFPAKLLPIPHPHVSFRDRGSGGRSELRLGETSIPLKCRFFEHDLPTTLRHGFFP